jgi:metallo-beta-lactamase class B
LLLATHGHWDHVGAMAEIKRLTRARMLMHEGDADLLESGGGQDFRFPEDRGIKVDRRLKDGEKVRLG